MYFGFYECKTTTKAPKGVGKNIYVSGDLEEISGGVCHLFPELKTTNV